MVAAIWFIGLCYSCVPVHLLFFFGRIGGSLRVPKPTRPRSPPSRAAGVPPRATHNQRAAAKPFRPTCAPQGHRFKKEHPPHRHPTHPTQSSRRDTAAPKGVKLRGKAPLPAVAAAAQRTQPNCRPTPQSNAHG